MEPELSEGFQDITRVEFQVRGSNSLPLLSFVFYPFHFESRGSRQNRPGRESPGIRDARASGYVYISTAVFPKANWKPTVARRRSGTADLEQILDVSEEDTRAKSPVAPARCCDISLVVSRLFRNCGWKWVVLLLIPMIFVSSFPDDPQCR